MEKDEMTGAVMTGIMGFAMIMIMIGLMGAYTPEVTYYCCPICGECFTSVGELESHFAAQHPAADIDITWE